MQLTFLGATHEVTGSCSYIELGGKKLLVDYGMEQGKDFFENKPVPVPVAELDAVLVTHAHIDHSGLLPVLAKNGFRGAVHATIPTCRLLDIMLRDSAHIQEFEAEWRNRKAERSGDEPYVPLYTGEDVQKLLKLLAPHDYDERFPLFDGADARFTDAGHLLGSAAVELWLREGDTERKIVFSGDLGNVNQPLMRDPVYVDEADYVVVESTYGDRVHEAPPDYARAFAEVLQRSFDRGGDVIIPSFAVGRTQELLYFLWHIKENRLVRGHDGFIVYVDSPLANAATRIFTENVRFCYDEETRKLLDAGVNPIAFPGLITTETADESKQINYDKRRKVIISASGMCEAGRIKHHLKHHLWDPKCSVVFVGFQAGGTLGRSLLDGAKQVKLFGEKVKVGAEITRLPGISAHADSKKLVDWVTHIAPKPREVFVNHGEDEVCTDFARRLNEACGLRASAPYSGSVYDLAAGAYIHEAAPEALAKAARAGEAAPGFNAAYKKLLAALERLTALVKKHPGRSNREVNTLAQAVTILADNWESE
ncbi:MAG: MBL fold metallo-hydrolase [Clostridia bacterium]|nr:MBL fold metallo-hydrolase [Clostridia bacterium]